MLFEVVTIDLHYMTDRQERFDLKISKLKILRKQRHLHLGCPQVKLKHTKNSFQSELVFFGVTAFRMRPLVNCFFVFFSNFKYKVLITSHIRKTHLRMC